ncbi:hypothetical protein HG530_013423 [Fusarium avenaceum]|nr:hypothetical protein HG530_013423 [Fusarium avenaceum]
MSLPLTDTRTTGVRQNNATSLLEGPEGAVTLKSGTDLLTAGGDVEVRSRLKTGLLSILQQALYSGHILVGAVGAAANETGGEKLGPFLFLNDVLELG